MELLGIEDVYKLSPEELQKKVKIIPALNLADSFRVVAMLLARRGGKEGYIPISNLEYCLKLLEDEILLGLKNGRLVS